jgi:hypothetical protein
MTLIDCSEALVSDATARISIGTRRQSDYDLQGCSPSAGYWLHPPSSGAAVCGLSGKTVDRSAGTRAPDHQPSGAYTREADLTREIKCNAS